MSSEPGSDLVDLFIIGGGVNGAAIARDAAGRGLSVTLAEKDDLAQATSSSSTKLFHGGLRYLEFFDFKLVREALQERDILWRAMPHISWPMRFVLPYSPDMRFEAETPASRLLSFFMPWMKGRRPAWMIRSGLFLYDHMGGHRFLPGTRRLDLRRDPAGEPLKPKYRLAWEYSDCWVQDSRLVALLARDAAAHGARIMTRTRVTDARRDDGGWRITTRDAGGAEEEHRARALVNAGGPWAKEIIRDIAHVDTTDGVRLVRGSHIVVPKLYAHDRCYLFQGRDGRIIFAIPYEQEFTLIGTTDKDHDGSLDHVHCTDEERDYLCAFASEYFRHPVTAADVVWSYAGVRPLYDDHASSATAATREYVLRLDERGAPLLNVFGGKITTHRRLAEHALEHLAPYFPNAGAPWTAGAPLAGGDFPADGVAALIERLRGDYPFLDAAHAARLVRTYGTEAFDLLGDATAMADLGEDFGATLTAREVLWLIRHEFARTAGDILWRRTKLGLFVDEAAAGALDAFVAAQLADGAGQGADARAGADAAPAEQAPAATGALHPDA